jgi:hypothetical protein
LLELLTALELRWLHSPPSNTAFTTELLGALPQPDELQRDAAATYFLEKIQGRVQPDHAPPLAKLLRDYTPLGSSSLAGQLRCEVALWQALRSQRAWTNAMLMPATEQESNIVAQLHQQPALAQRRVQVELLSNYAPRRSLCVAAIATQMLMKQLPTVQMYVPPVTRALQKLSGTGPAIEIVPTAPEHPLLQVTVQTMPPRLVQWKLK